MKMKQTVVLIILIWFSQATFSQSVNNYYLVIYDGTPASISAAIQASRMGKTVVVIEPTNRIGGLTTNEL